MILDEILVHRREQLDYERQLVSLRQVKQRAQEQLSKRAPLSLCAALKKERLSCICEVKKASPSKGLIRQDFVPVELAKTYAIAGAEAISVLTESHYFQGSNAYLAAIREAVDLPLLRKDFIFDPYQVYEAAALGADALLLIAALLERSELEALFGLAHELGLEVLMEVHNEEEIRKIESLHPRLLGVNNRDLRTFHVDLHTVERLRPLLPGAEVFVSESGIRKNADMRMVRKLGADAVLIGETLMRSEQIPQTLYELRKGV